MKRIGSWIIVVLIQCVGIPAIASELNYSGRSDIWENPFLAYGYNPKTNLITGYLAALRTAPGRTDECKLAFAGNSAETHSLSVKYMAEAGQYKRKNPTDSGVSIALEKSGFHLKFSKKMLGGDCDWILPFVVGPRVSETSDEVIVAMKVPNSGSWVGVYAISAKRAKFHSRPDNASVQKAFLVAGDVIYVYDERPDWYFVQYEEGKRKTVGWIRRSDTVQP
jgi:hypothetical protein